MSVVRTFQQDLAKIARFWEAADYDAALDRVEEARKAWPGNAHFQILWASLVQLQDDPKHTLDEAKQAIQQAVEWDETSPAGSIELGHFLDRVENDPDGATQAYARGIALARNLLIDGLIGQAQALLQVDRADEAFRHVLELLHLHNFERTAAGPTAGDLDVSHTLRASGLSPDKLQSPSVQQVEELLDQVLARRSA